MIDACLLASFVETKSSDVYAHLVKRHVGLVYGAAMRQVRDHHLAEEVTQTVFILLARKAVQIRSDCHVASWLLKATSYAAKDALKLRRRRCTHESRAAEMIAVIADQPSGPVESVITTEMLRLLDEGLNRLSETDRRAVLLRFYEQKPFEEVGGGLGLGADAARKRVARAVEKLRTFIVRRSPQRSTAATTAGVIALLAGHLRVTAPSHLAARINSGFLDGSRTALADTVSARLARHDVVKWTIGLTAALGVVATLLVSAHAIPSPLWPNTSHPAIHE